VVALLLALAATWSGGTAPAWSPDGKEIAYVGPAPYRAFVGQTLTDLDNLDHVFVVPVDGSGPRRIVATAPKEGTIQAIALAPGGVVYQDSNYTLRAAPSGRPARKVAIVGVAGWTGVAFALSPDGRASRATRSTSCRPWAARRDCSSSPAARRNGRRTDVGSSAASIGVVDLNGNVTRLSFPGLRPTGGAGPPPWSPDGRAIAFAARGSRGDLDLRVYVVAADGDGLRRIA
jgi:Tol biopolymer transport system component